MANLKHVGRIKNNQRKVIVAYRTVPNEPESAVVVTTENLMADEHDALMKLVDSNAGQTAYEFAEAMARAVLPDGRNMLAAFHTTGKMVKVPTTTVEMTPDTRTKIMLNDLNQMIADQKGVTIAELALNGGSAPEVTDVAEVNTLEAVEEVLPAGEESVLTDDQLAAQYRSQADALFKEAKRLREQAEDLAPTKRKKKIEESA